MFNSYSIFSKLKNCSKEINRQLYILSSCTIFHFLSKCKYTSYKKYYPPPKKPKACRKWLLPLCCRDSGQPDVFFTLSYQSDDGPTSVRVVVNNLLFSLYGSHKTFASLFALLSHYTGSSCKLTGPYRRQQPESLKQMCRRAFIRTYGADSICTLPGLSTQVKDYVHAYPYCI